MLMRKHVFEQLNGFDEEFFISFEDVDLGWRARNLGYKIMLVPDSIVYHVGGQTIKNIEKTVAFHGFKNQLSMKITNFEFRYVIRSLFLFFILYGIRSFQVWLDYFVKGHTDITSTKYEKIISKKPDYVSIIRGIFWNFQHFRYLLRKHKLVNSTRIVSTKNLTESHNLTFF